MSIYKTASVKIDSASPELPREADFLRIWKGVVEPTVKWFDGLADDDYQSIAYANFREKMPKEFPDIDRILHADDAPEPLTPYAEAVHVDNVTLVTDSRQQAVVVLELARKLANLDAAVRNHNDDSPAKRLYWQSVGRAFTWTKDNLRIDMQVMFVGRCIKHHQIDCVPSMVDDFCTGGDPMRTFFEELGGLLNPITDGDCAFNPDPGARRCLNYAISFPKEPDGNDFNPALTPYHTSSAAEVLKKYE